MVDVNEVSLNPEDYPKGASVAFTVKGRNIILHGKVVSSHYFEEAGRLCITLRSDVSSYGDLRDIVYYEASGECILRFKPKDTGSKGDELYGTITSKKKKEK